VKYIWCSTGVLYSERLDLGGGDFLPPLIQLNSFITLAVGRHFSFIIQVGDFFFSPRNFESLLQFDSLSFVSYILFKI
jgi:hypothetical protein